MTEKLIKDFKDVTESLRLYDILAADGLTPVSELHRNDFKPISRSLQIYITVNTTDKGRMSDMCLVAQSKVSDARWLRPQRNRLRAAPRDP